MTDAVQRGAFISQPTCCLRQRPRITGPRLCSLEISHALREGARVDHGEYETVTDHADPLEAEDRAEVPADSFRASADVDCLIPVAKSRHSPGHLSARIASWDTWRQRWIWRS